ncbi:protein kinase [Micromonospora sp. D93]|uniref:serine/threonine-protein kinase n=1 Tax=Micromonospora sp. D93 TaxID=2824886 RepID=UPI001B388706|nr:serine/threonine-protein kinase [Micromonospora sp. D93]MBQ1016842.1 protein kinase [Micromonospora sp. D93]
MRILQQRYRLDEPVGQGGMAVVWRGFDLRLQRTVAVKMLSAELLDDPAARERLRAEALAAAKLDHPHIAGVFDYGEQRRLRRRVPFIVMEFVDGETLAGRLQRSGPMAWREAARTGAAVADALAAAHAHGLVHRDVKPGNVMLGPRGVKVVDLGIATGVGQEPADSAGLVWGTPAYLAPEQAAGATAAPAGDVFALGLVLVECVSGRSANDLRRGRDGDELPSIPEMPAGVADLVRRCLATDVDRRPAAAEVAAVLRTVSGTEVALRPSGPVADLPATAGSTRQFIAGSSAVAGIGRKPHGPTGTPHRAGHRRVRSGIAVGVPAVLLAAVLVGQLPGRKAVDDVAGTDISAAGAGGVADAQDGECAARYTAHHLPDGTFRADLTVTNTGGQWLRDWSLAFALPPGQRLVTDDTPWDQDRRHVTFTPATQLAPGATLAAVLRGTTEGDNLKVPAGFSVNGLPCNRVVSQIASPVVAPDAPSAPGVRTAAPGRRPTKVATGPRSAAAPESPTVPQGSETPSPAPDPSVGTPSPATPSTTAQPDVTTTPSSPSTDPSPSTGSASPPAGGGPTTSPRPGGSPSTSSTAGTPATAQGSDEPSPSH